MRDSARPRINAAALLLAGGDPALPALVCGGQRLCRGELRGAVALAAAAWLDCEVRPGELVLVRARQDIEHAVAFLGAIWAGAVPMPLSAPANHLARHPGLGVRFVLDLTREGHAERWRDQVMTLAEWRMYLALSRPAEAVAMPPDAAACWSEARDRDGGGARLLAHRFALAPAAPTGGGQRGCASVSGVLGMLRMLRRGGTAVLAPRGVAGVHLPAHAGEALALP